MWNSLPPATRAIIAANVVAFLLQQVIGATMVRLFALWPVSVPLFEPWQLVTYAFLHGSIPHIFFNMFALFMFGRALEYFWGSRRFIVFYFACVISAAATQLLMSHLSGSMEPTIGASGGVFGLLLAFAMYFPRQRITLLFPPIPMPAWLFVTLYGALELVLGVTNTQAGVAHFAHLGGMLGGAIVILYWRARRISSP
jgi:membrane associated rhomboid family serine protease